MNADTNGRERDVEHERHPWRRYVALGDSFTEGVGDPEPSAPNGLRGWADRVAEALGADHPDFAYANLAIRGRLLDQIVAEQIEPAIALHPDLVTISAGGNDLIRPGADADAISARFERAIARLRATGATVVVFTGVDTQFAPVFSQTRGKVAIYNENVRAIAAEYDCVVADQWALRSIQNAKMWTSDRLHLNPYGHHEVARMVLRALNVDNDLRELQPEPVRPARWREARTQDIVWAREFLVPWVLRRIRHQSSGDNVQPKRPEPLPLDLLADQLGTQAVQLGTQAAQSVAESTRPGADNASAPDGAAGGDLVGAPDEVAVGGATGLAAEPIVDPDGLGDEPSRGFEGERADPTP